MAVRVCTANSTLTSGTWRRSEYTMLNLVEWNSNQYYDDINTERFLAVTFANAGNQVGINFYLLSTPSDTSAVTITIKLQEYTGGSWVTRTTDTFLGTNTNIPGRNGMVYFPLTTYAVTTAASTWRYSIKCDTGTGKFALRFQPTSSTNPLTYSELWSIPNLVGGTYSVGVWIRINKEAYWAGIHTNPTLTLTYDGNQTVSAVAINLAADSASELSKPEAERGWQYVSVNFTPTDATKGDVTVELKGATDATSTNAYFYVDDWGGGSLVNNGMDKWSKALPVPAAWSFLIDVSTFWGSLKTRDYGTNSMGKLLTDNIDAAINSRLASASYTAPDNANIGAIKTALDTNLDAKVSEAGGGLTTEEHDALLAVPGKIKIIDGGELPIY